MRDLIDDCVHCGFCLPTCPTYTLWNEEMDSPRGRIVLMGRLEETDTVSDAMVTHFDRCLGCMACVTACPSGVQYDKLITTTRARVEEAGKRPRRERVLRKIVYGLFTHPERLKRLVPLTAAGRRLGAIELSARSKLPLLRTLGELAPRLDADKARERPPAVLSARGETRGRVALLQGCVQRAFFGDVNAATARVLAAEGWEVHAPEAPRCCGALQYHEGDHDDARALAQETMDALGDYDAIVVNAAGCGSAMKAYGHLVGDGRSAAFAEKVKDVTELLAGAEPRAERKPVELRVAYHDACHLAHAQGIRQPPRQLLRSIPGLDLLEPAEPDTCCGSAGIYNLLQPEAASELGRRKADHLIATGAQAIAAANPGCTLQIVAHLAAQGRELPVYHPVQLLDASIAGGGAP
ncbi:MAG TPA: heterodisulfide reductase-related iron-sulfur binding cluster [Solirubrobacteraceae bacterium]|jgi:glycolate oxidase iron-sulfur subunit|nr:heterodisulfide reductase-related iron-sulfur binding cluster [Solirubrobacteraceae bacterium]